MNNYPIGWEAITANPHRRSRYTETAERINHFANRGADLMELGIISRDCLEEIDKLYDRAHICEYMAGGGIIFNLHDITLARDIEFVTTLDA